jgi:argininosuccinate synthase
MNKAWDGNDVKGFTKLMSNYLKIYNKVNGFDVETGVKA